ncbi:MAG TPA: RtcB family protein [Planctomycetota bacterium]|nr:RtcB family protein [Planctomycetota bacterium]
MKPKELLELGIPQGEAMKRAIGAVRAASRAGKEKMEIESDLIALVEDPDRFAEDEVYGELATYLLDAQTPAAREQPVPYRRWGDEIEPTALGQMESACRLPISVRGALMPDAHQGYGLPIGGVLAVRDAVIPYAVGMDIACRMKLTVLDLPVEALTKEEKRREAALVRETDFGVGASFARRREHPVMDEDWSVSPVTIRHKDRAWAQLGTSGSGNHFVEYGVLTVDTDALGLAPGTYLAILSHSGSRGTGGEVARYYSDLAMRLHRDLPKELLHLAWLSLASQEGQEYWQAMELMGRYAAASHALIHQSMARALGVNVLLDIENHHNFAWKEEHYGEQVVVHRKGATPAGRGVIGIIPGSMATPAFVVRGKGEPESLNSASHGAGRKMSRTEAKRRFRQQDLDGYLAERGVKLLSAGIDEAPMAYKKIEEVMAAQADLVEPLAKFEPKLVRMAPGTERAED